MTLDLENHFAISDVQESYSRIVSRYHSNIGIQKLDACDLSAACEFSSPISATYRLY
jgi:hypothetical protein